MVSLLAVCGRMERHLPGAQTERRGDAGLVGGLRGSKDPTGRVHFAAQNPISTVTAEPLAATHPIVVRERQGTTP
jgi:hypothetical protein